MRRIVHVDNSKFFRKLMKIFLSELGLECQGFDRGEDAIDAVYNGDVSCVITGLELPDMSGEQLIRKVLTSGHSLTIIAVTASGDEERVKNLEVMGVKATIQKTSDWKEKLREYL
jgi:DNA-binding response OmpR family regulator